jgi:hypothetical protein
MEAHTGAVTFPSEWAKRPRPRRLKLIRQRIRARKDERAARAYAARANRALPSSIPGSGHTHLLPPKAY